MTEIRETSRWFACGMALCLLARVCAAVEFDGGTGEPNDPYQIATAEQFIAISSDSNLLDKHYVLVADIALDPASPGGRVFDGPVIAMIPEQSGITADPNFTGTLDGRGFRIRNLVIHAQAGSTVALGLFGRIGGEARVRNLAIERVSIRGDVGTAAAGALVGVNWGLVEACYATGSVTGVGNVGGLCGENRGRVTSFYAAASVSGEQYVGGLIGYGGLVISRATRGPVAGRGSVINCYASGAVSGIENVGGLVGAGGTTQDSFWDVQTSGQKAAVAGGGLPTFQMMDAIVFAAFGWGEDPNWVMDDGRDYPRLSWERTDGQPIHATTSERFEGAGTPRDPYHIATAEQFALLGLLPGLSNQHFALDADLDLAGIPVRPITYFNGFLHGNRHTLRHLSVEVGKPEYACNGLLFYRVGSEGRVTYLGFEEVAITVNMGPCAIGVLAAINEGVVTGCYATGTVQAGQSQSTISLVADNQGMLARSYIRMIVAGSDWTGGLVSRNSRLSITSTTSGSSRTVYSGFILDCYAAMNDPEGAVTGELVGGNNGLALNSYFLAGTEGVAVDSDPMGQSSSALSHSPVGTPLADSQMRQAASFVGWDFAGSSDDGRLDRWSMPEDGYPILSWQVDREELRPIPDIADLPLDWAQTELELAGFTIGEILHDYHSTIPRERAILTSPVGFAPIGCQIDIIVSQGGANWSSAPSGSYYGYVPPIARLETPGQVECQAGDVWGEDVVLLTRDIDMAGWDILPEQTQSFTAAFTGVFIGQGHKISHLKTYRDGVFFDQIGADGFVYGLCLEDVLMLGSGATSVGGLAAENKGVVMQCAVSGTVRGSENTLNLGGLVGKNAGTIESCAVDMTVRTSPRESSTSEAASRTVGGMVGYSNGDLVGSYSRGSVSGMGYVGGLAGSNEGTIENCYSAAFVAGHAQDTTGGLAGRTYHTPPVSRGRPVPPVTSIPLITDCYFLGLDDNGGPDNGLGTPLTEAQMKQQASFAGWDFEDTWTICEGVDYPRLRWEVVNCEVGP